MQKIRYNKIYTAAFLMILNVNTFAASKTLWSSKHLNFMDSYFEKYCYDCHGDSSKKGDVSLMQNVKEEDEESEEHKANSPEKADPV